MRSVLYWLAVAATIRIVAVYFSSFLREWAVLGRW